MCRRWYAWETVKHNNRDIWCVQVSIWDDDDDNDTVTLKTSMTNVSRMTLTCNLIVIDIAQEI